MLKKYNLTKFILKRQTLLVVLLALCTAVGLPTASLQAQCAQTTEGTDFWLGFMRHNEGDVIDMRVVIASSTATSGSVFIDGGTTLLQNFTVAANSSTTIVIPAAAEIQGSEVAENKAIRITSLSPVNVYAINKKTFSTDATLIFPKPTLGTLHYALMYRPPQGGAQYRSQFLIVATENNTQVTITPKAATLGGVAANGTINVTLQEGQTYQVRSNVGNNNTGDLTGSKIVSNKPVAVFSGNQRARIPAGICCYDHLFEQSPPTNTWGRDFISIPLLQRSYDVFRVLARENGTIVTRNGVAQPVLNEGDFFEFDTQASNTPQVISSNKPVLVAHFSTSRDTDGLTNADPFMIYLSPNKQTVQNINFEAFNLAEIYLNVLTRTSNAANVQLDGAGLTFTPIAGTQYSFARTPLVPGTRNITDGAGTDGLIAYVYGFDAADSYGYMPGLSLQTVLDVGQDTTFCTVGNSVPLDAGDDFTNIQWRRLPSNTVLATTQLYTPTQSGQYEVRGTDNFGCLRIDTIEVVFNTPPIADIKYNGQSEDALVFCQGTPNQILDGFDATNPAGVTYQWRDLSNNTIVGTNATLSVGGFTGTKNFELTVFTTALHCQGVAGANGVDVISVTFNPPPIASITHNGGAASTNFTFCDADGAQTLSAANPANTGNLLYEWFLGTNTNVAPIATGTSLIVDNFSTTRNYTLKISNLDTDQPCEVTQAFAVTFKPIPETEISLAGSVVSGQTLNFCDTEGEKILDGTNPALPNGIIYEWFIGTNTTAIANTPTLAANLFSSSTTYRLRVRDPISNLCFTEKEVTIVFYPTANVGNSQLTFCDSEGAQVIAGSNVDNGNSITYVWRDITDPLNPIVVGNNRLLTVANFSATTVYQVEIIDPNLANPCPKFDEVTVTFNTNPTPEIRYAGSPATQVSVCAGASDLDLDATTAGNYSYQWAIVDANNNTLSSLGTNPTIAITGFTAATQNRRYRLTLTDNNTGCQAQTITEVTLAPELTASFSSNRTRICENETAQVSFNITGNFPVEIAYEYTDPQGNTTLVTESIGTATTPSPFNYTFASDGGTYTLVSLQDAVCQNLSPAPSSVQIEVVPVPTPTLTATATEICQGESITFTAAGADSFQFYINGLPMSSTSPTTWVAPASILNNGDKVWAIGTTEGCSGQSNEIVLTVNPNPTVDIGVDRFKCVGDTAIIVATMPEPTNFIYDWRKYDFDNDIWAQVGNGNDTLFALDTGWYKVRLQNVTTGCEGFSNAVFIYDYDTLKVDLGQDRRVCDPSDLPFRLVAADLSHPNSVVYEWYETGDNTILGTDSTYDVPQEGFYSVIVKDLLRGCEVRDTVRIQLKPDPDFELLEEQNQDCADEKRLYIEATNIENMLVSWTFSGIGTGIVSVSNDNLSAIVNQAGTYTVTVSDTTFGVICTLSKSIDVNIRPRLDVAGATLPDDEIVACQTDTLRFDAFNFTHEPDYEYVWRNLATGEVISDDAHVEIVFEDSYTPTRFEIQVTDAAGCQVRDTITVRFERQSQVEILETYAQAACAGETINLTAQGADNYTWTASYGTISGTGANATFSSDSAGIFQIIVKGGFPTGCPESSDTVSVRILNNPTLNLPTEIVLCESDSITLSAFLPTHQPRYQYEWRDAAGNLLSDSVVYTFSFDKLAEPTYEPQSYQVRVFDEVLGATCEAISEITVRFTRQSQVEIVALDTATCIGDSIVLQAQGGDSFAWYERNGLVDSLISTQNSVTLSRSKAGLYPYILRGTYEGSVCDSSESVIWLEFVAPPVVSLNQPDTVSICTTDSLLLIASGAVRYEWLHAPNLTNDSLTVRPNDTTLYVVKGYNETGCFSYDSVVVLVQPKVELGEPREYCEGERDTLRVLRPQGAEFLWSTGERGDSLVIFRSGTYILTVSIGECSYRDTLEVRYRNLPRLSLKDTTLCFEDSLYGQRVSYQYGVSVLNYDSTATYAYVWQDAEGNIISTDSLVEIGQGGAYQVSVTATYDKGCAAQTAMLIEEVCPPTLYIPDAFSPNADGLNDEWKIFGSYWSNMRIRVYNAWGQLVWYANYRDENDNPQWWDGTHNGKHVPTGVYLYELTFTPKNAPSRTLLRSGKVSIVK